MTADIFGLPASRLHTSETCSLGAAIDAAVGVRLFSDFRTAIGHMTRLERTFAPNINAYEIYDQLYERMYGSLRQFYSEIQRITGDPELITQRPSAIISFALIIE